MQASGRQKTRTHTQERRVGHPPASLNIRRDGYGFTSTLKAQEKSPGPREMRGRPGLQRPTHASHKTRRVGHSHAGERETENEDPQARTACGAPEKAKADASPHANGRDFLATRERCSRSRGPWPVVRAFATAGPLPLSDPKRELPRDDIVKIVANVLKQLTKLVYHRRSP